MSKQAIINACVRVHEKAMDALAAQDQQRHAVHNHVRWLWTLELQTAD